jgi:hypothetical protein
VVERFYVELWNRWQLGVAEELVLEEIRFRGSLGAVCEGRDDFVRYVETVPRSRIGTTRSTRSSPSAIAW